MNIDWNKKFDLELPLWAWGGIVMLWFLETVVLYFAI